MSRNNKEFIGSGGSVSRNNKEFIGSGGSVLKFLTRSLRSLDSDFRKINSLLIYVDPNSVIILFKGPSENLKFEVNIPPP